MESTGSYPYTEPSLAELLTFSSFLVLLNFARKLTDWLVNGAGLLGEILVGIIYGTPLAGILSDEWMSTLGVVGYVGLCAMVLEGGINTPLAHALPCLPLSLCVAATGIIFPILVSLLYFSLVLRSSYPTSLLHSFAAGAALSSTSLGTTFAVITSAGLEKGRLGAVLMSAAMADDVVGLILLKVVVALGQDASAGGTSIGWFIGRPLVASVGMIIVSWIIAKCLLRPSILILLKQIPHAWQHEANLTIIVLVTAAYIAVASLTGTSVLLGAFVAGVVLASIRPPPSISPFEGTFTKLVSPVLSTFLQPIFFASIGFAIPIKQMFTASVVWRGIVFSILQILAKAVTGVWIPIGEALSKWWISNKKKHNMAHQNRRNELTTKERKTRSNEDKDGKERQTENNCGTDANIGSSCTPETVPVRTPPTPPPEPAPTMPMDDPDASSSEPSTPFTTQAPVFSASSTPPPASDGKPTLLLPSVLLSLAMVARGEIGLLIAQLAYTSALLEKDLYLVSVWAIVVCTTVGPLGVGWCVRRWRKEEVPGRWGDGDEEEE